MTDDRLVLSVEFHAAPGRAGDLREALLALVGPTRAEDGCELYDLHDDPADPHRFVFYEIWSTPAAHAAHDRTEHVQGIVAALPRLTVESPRVLRLRRIEPEKS